MRLDIQDNLLQRIAGVSDAPALVFLHAFADSGAVFLPLFRTRLAEHFCLIAVDLPGFGASPARTDVRTISDYASIVARVVDAHCRGGRVGIVAHSATSMIAVEVTMRTSVAASGVFSIEGNLTEADAYFTGLAAEHDDPVEYKVELLRRIAALAEDGPALRHYHANAAAADATAMWHLGRDTKRRSAAAAAGAAYQAARVPTLYYWSAHNTPAETAAWIERSQIPNRQFAGASHWPMLDQPEETAKAIDDFFC